MSEDHRSDKTKREEYERHLHLLASIPGIGRPICYVHDAHARQFLNPYDPVDHECHCAAPPTASEEETDGNAG